MEDVSHAHGTRVGEEHEAQVRGGLIEVELVVCGTVGDEGIVVAAQLANHVAEGEDCAEDELGVIGTCGRLLRADVG